MLRQLSVLTLLTTLTLACDRATGIAPADELTPFSGRAATQLPGDGNDQKQVVEVFVQNPVNCGGGKMLTRTLTGWIQVMTRENGASATQEITTYRVDYTFTNAANETFVVRDRGIDRVYIEDGVAYLQISGQTPVHMGILRINLATGEQVFEAGPDYDIPRNRACAAL